MKDKVTCKAHGEAIATYVCEHLVGASGVGWHSAPPDNEELWPNAWCDQCNKAFEKEGEWNEHSEAEANLKAKLLCNFCYEEFRNRCTVHHV